MKPLRRLMTALMLLVSLASYGQSAGPNQVLSCVALQGLTVTMGATGTGTWTTGSGNPWSATITSSSSPTTSITNFGGPGVYHFNWTTGSGSSSVQITITEKPNAGVDMGVMPGGYVTTHVLTSAAGTWTPATGNPATTAIVTPSSRYTDITGFSTAGIYRYIWTTTGNGCADTLAVTVSAGCTLAGYITEYLYTTYGQLVTTISGGSGRYDYAWQFFNRDIPDYVININNNSSYSVVVTDTITGCQITLYDTVTGLTCSAHDTIRATDLGGGHYHFTCTYSGMTSPTYQWLLNETFPIAPGATTSFDTTFSPGIYQVGVRMNTGTCYTTDSVAFIVPAGPAGFDQSLSCVLLPGGSVTMAGTGSGTWTALPGNPGSATITVPASATTSITNFTAAGVYSFLWTTSGGILDTATVTITQTGEAGPNQSVTIGSTVTMAGSGPGTWSSPPGNPHATTINTPSSPTTTVTGFTVVGNYYFYWMNGSCLDYMIVNVSAAASAGPDRSLSCISLPGGSVTMAGTGTGAWTVASGNPGTATISNTSSPTTSILNFSAAGIYRFIWTSGGVPDTALVTVTAKPNAGPDKFIACVTLPGGLATMTATGIGTWTALAGNPGTCSITNPTSPTTSIATFSAAGIYTFRWTNGSCADTAIVIVTAKTNAGPDKSATISGSATMAATGTGTWSALSGNPGTTTIVSVNSPTTAITSFSAAGTYSFSWTNNGCSDTATVVVSSSSACGMILTDSTHRASCQAANNAEVFIYASGGTSPYQYRIGINGTWQSSNHYTSDYSYLSFEKYYVKDATGCIDSISVSVGYGFTAVPSISYIPLGNRTYRFTANDVGYYHPHYWWMADHNLTTTNGPKSYTYTFPTTGSHAMEVTVYDSTVVYCPVDDSVRFVIPASCSLHDSISYTALGGTQYRFSANTTGATRPGYFWTVPATWTRVSGSGGTAIYSVPSAGIYSVTLTTVDSTTECGFTQTINVNLSPSCSLVLYDTVSDPSCTLGNGSVSLTAAAGTPPYQYRMGINGAWQSSSVFSGLDWGIDTFYVMDAGSCVLSVIDTLIRSGYPSLAPTSNSPVALGGIINLFRNGSGSSGFTSTNWTGPNSFASTTINPTISNATNAATGFYTVKYGNIICKATDSVLVIVGSGGAGLDQLLSCVTLPGGVATMHAYGSGTWTVLSGNPGTATITAPTSATTTITNFNNAGVYSFLYTMAGGQIDTARVTVTTMPDAGPDKALGCAPLSGGSVTMSATGTGTWTARTGNPGTSHITTTTSPTTTITTFSAPGTYYYIWTNAGGCKDTAAVTVTSIPNAPILYATGGCPGTDTLTINVVAATNQITWLLNGGIVHTATPTDTTFVPSVPGSYTATVTSGLCQSAASNATTLLSCLSDSVWPGDANHDGLADNTDLLPIGIAYGLNGFTRTDQSIVWSAHYAADWGVQFVSGVNTKHADCDGNAVVDANDTVAIMQNFSLTHSKTTGYGQPWRSGTPGIKLLYSKDTLATGDTLTVSLLLGDSVVPAANIYGLAFNYHYDPLVLDTATSSFGYTNSFLGNNTNMIQLHKDFKGAGIIRTAVTGINHLNRNGYGIIGHFRCIITTDNINGKDLAYYSNINFISDIVAIDKDENPITLNAGTDSNYIAYEPTGIHDVSEAAHILLSPNPAATQVRVSADAMIHDIQVTDMIGAEVYRLSTVSGRSQMIDISGLSSGIYTVRIATSSGIGTARLTVSR